MTLVNEHGEVLINNRGGLKTWWTKDESTGLSVIRTSQDVQTIIDGNIAMQNSGASHATKDRSMMHAARIPDFVYYQWAKKYGIPKADILKPQYKEIIRRELNDPDNKFLRIWPGKV